MLKPTLDQVKKYGQEYDIVPVSMEIFADSTTPISVLKALKNISKTTYLLESVESCGRWSRYSFLGFDPSLEIACKNHVMSIKGKDHKEFHTDDPTGEIRKILAQYRAPIIAGLPTFTGGLVGYFAYEYARYSEPRFDKKLQELNRAGNFNDVDLMLFDKVIAFDHYRQKIVLIVNIRTDNLEANYEQAKQDLKFLANLVLKGTRAEIKSGRLLSDFKGDFTQAEFHKGVEKIQHHIYEGDIFQAVISNKLRAKYEGSLFNAYRVLRTVNPSPYMFYLSSEFMELTGASPETLVKLNNGKLQTFPIAGTRKRGADELEDVALEKDLLGDEKELAEHDMLVDLGRNDLGKIAKFGSVKVTDFHKIQRFSHVMHITSTVMGEIKEAYDALDAIVATLPAGTLSGAPKLRAMEILAELEPAARGIYGGAIGYIDFAGNMDVCIGIRMAVCKDGEVHIQSGGGVVKDSTPEGEYQESQNKAKSMMVAILEGQEVDENDFIN